ncbi:DUF421 domain-containing protein [Roseibium salinum]|nr:DUF421 domain-containing protein [Roseibium salinum]
MSIRAVLVFVFGLVLIRLFGRRAFGQQTALDIFLAIIVGSNLGRAITGNAPFGPTLAATMVLAILYWIVRHATARFSRFSNLIKGHPIPLVEHGRLKAKAMRGAAVSVGDIDESARESGLPGLDSVEEARLERSGRISTRSGGSAE